jgi:hypothetical protein
MGKLITPVPLSEQGTCSYRVFSLHDMVFLTHLGLCSITCRISHQRFYLNANKGIKSENMKDLHCNMRSKFLPYNLHCVLLKSKAHAFRIFLEVLKIFKYAIFSSGIETHQVPRIRLNMTYFANVLYHSLVQKSPVSKT